MEFEDRQNSIPVKPTERETGKGKVKGKGKGTGFLPCRRWDWQLPGSGNASQKTVFRIGGWPRDKS